MKAKRISRTGKTTVHGLHTMAPTLDTTIFYSDGSTGVDKVVLSVEPSPATLNLRYLHEPNGNCVGCFTVNNRDTSLKLFV